MSISVTEACPAVRRVRTARGSAIAEFGPALFIILICGLLPTIDGICLGVDYASLYYLNEMQLREAVRLPRSQATDPNGPVINGVTQEWRSTMLGGMVDQGAQILTNLDYAPVPWTPVGATSSIDFWFVTVDTQITFRPFFKIPFFNGVPGLGANATMSVNGRRPVENNRFLNE